MESAAVAAVVKKAKNIHSLIAESRRALCAESRETHQLFSWVNLKFLRPLPIKVNQLDKIAALCAVD